MAEVHETPGATADCPGDDLSVHTSEDQQRALVSNQLAEVATGSLGLGGLGLKVRYYIALESTWQVALYAVCYRYRPTILVMQSERARAVATRVGEWMKRWNWGTVSKMGANVYNSPWKLALAEWTIINKLAAPVSFPTKIYAAHLLANRTVQKREHQASAAPSTTAHAGAEGSAEGSRK